MAMCTMDVGIAYSACFLMRFWDYKVSGARLYSMYILIKLK